MSDPVAQSVREALKRWYELIDSAHAVGDPELAADLQQRIDSALTQAVTDNAIRKRQPRCTHWDSQVFTGQCNYKLVYVTMAYRIK